MEYNVDLELAVKNYIIRNKVLYYKNTIKIIKQYRI